MGEEYTRDERPRASKAVAFSQLRRSVLAAGVTNCKTVGGGSRSMLKISAPTSRGGSAAAPVRMGELFPAYEPLAAKVS